MSVSLELTGAAGGGVKVPESALRQAGWIMRGKADRYSTLGEELEEVRDSLRIARESTTAVGDVVERWHYDQPTETHPGPFKFCSAAPCKAVTAALDEL